MKFNEGNEYYLVRGWFEETAGIHNGSFYGAMAPSASPLSPARVVVNGPGAESASKMASSQPAVVYPEEILESHDVGGLNPRERGDTEHMLLDNPEWVPGVRDWCGQHPGAQVYHNGNQLFVSFHDAYTSEEADEMLATLQSLAPGVEIASNYESGPAGEGWRLVNEMTGSGAIGMRPFALGVQSPTNTSKLGMSDRGGHGQVDNLGRGKKDDPKKIRPGRNIKGSKRHLKSKSYGLKGFGNKTIMPTINQGGGRKGGSN